VRAASSTQDRLVFAARTLHFVFEFITTSSAKEQAGPAYPWAMAFREAAQKADEENVLSASYISLTSPKEVDCAKIYGENCAGFVDLKKWYDPRNLFRHALPKFG
jgi:hypothetical protein